MSSSYSVLLALGCLLTGCGVAFGWQNPELVADRFRIKLTEPFKWQELKPDALKVTYNPMEVFGSLVLTLHGYAERNLTRISKVKTPFTLLATVPLPDTVFGEVDILQLDLKCAVKDDECNKYDMGFAQISQQKRDNHTKTQSLVTQIIPLGWFLEKNYAKESFNNWAFGKCRTWHKSEVNVTDIGKAMKNASCPITMSAAHNDPGWYLKSNYLAGYYSEGAAAALPAQACFYSAIEHVPMSMHASPASLCCYRTSDSMLLQKEFMATGEQRLHGSSVLRSHPGGSDAHPEHYLQGQVPYLSHWYWDRMPFLYCCLWWKGSTCADYYLKLRPAPQVQRKPAGSQAAYVVASDIQSMMNGTGSAVFCPHVGEFWLVRSPAIEVQMRNYVVSSYIGGYPVNGLSHSQFAVAGSKSAFVTAIAMRSLDSPHLVVELICAEGEFRSYVQATNRNTSTTAVFDGNLARGMGRNIMVGDVLRNISNSQNTLFSFLVKHSVGRVGILAFVVEPIEEFMNLYLTLSSGLLAESTGLMKGGECLANRVEKPEERLFSTVCDNCEDIEKYSTGRPLYYEDVPEDLPRLPQNVPILDACTGDPTCRYMAWSTQFPPYHKSTINSKTYGIEPMLKILHSEDWDACQNPNTLTSGVLISQDQSFNESAIIKLTCVKPLSSSSEGATATCTRSGPIFTFDIPSDFKCIGGVTEEAKEVEVKQQEAKVADESYTKKHYTPELEASTKTGVFGIGSPLVPMIVISAALTGLLILP